MTNNQRGLYNKKKKGGVILIYNKNTIGIEIKKMMLEKGVSQKDIASKIGRTQQALNRSIKDGNMRLNSLAEIADAMGCLLEINFIEK